MIIDHVIIIEEMYGTDVIKGYLRDLLITDHLVAIKIRLQLLLIDWNKNKSRFQKSEIKLDSDKDA